MPAYRLPIPHNDLARGSFVGMNHTDESAAGDFAADTRVRPGGGPGRWTCTIPEAWKVFFVFGGISMAVVIRAIAAELATDDQRPLAANATFCSPIPCGPVDIETRVLRRGRSASQGCADLRVAGSDDIALHATATFARPGAWDKPLATAFPAGVPAPDATPAPEEPPDEWPFPQTNFHKQSEWRPVVGNAPWRRDWEPGEPRAVSWFRLAKPAVDAHGVQDPLALCVPADTLGSAMGQGLGPMDPDEPIHLLLTIDMGIQWFGDAHGEWVLQDSSVPHLDHGFGMSTVQLFDEKRDLVAHAYQRALLREMSSDMRDAL